MYVVGDPVQSWDNNTTYRISTGYGADHKYYTVVYMENGEHFALSNGSTRYAPKSQHYQLGIGTAAYQGDYDHTGYSFEYTGPTGLVKICISQDGLDNTYYPYVWVEKYWDPKDDINAVLGGTKVMFYWGDVYNNGDGNGWKYLYNGTGHSDQKAFWLAKRQVSGVPVGGNSWNNFAWGAASVASGQYYISNSSGWDGRQMGESAVAGKAYMAHSSGVQASDNRSLATFSSASYSIEYGTSASSVSASCNNTTSAIGKTNSIYKYYTKPSAGSTWSEFDPSQNISLAPGTYNLAVIVTDGLIYVKGATTTLTVTETTYSVTVARNNNSYGTVSSSSVTAGAYTKPEVTATPNKGYYFTGWTLPTGVTAADGYSASSNPIRIHASASSKTITANFAKRFVLRGSRSDGSGDEGMPGFSTTTADMTIDGSGVSSKTVTLLPNREYKFMIYDKLHGRQCGYTSENQTLGANTWTGSMNGTYHILMNTAGYGIYTFEVDVSAADGSGNTWPKVRITNPASYQLTTLGRKVIYNEDNSTLTDASDTNGGTVTAHTNENSTGYDITSGKWFASGSNITFTATPATGYRVAGWYSNSACTTPYTAGANVSISADKNTLTLSSCTAAKTVYVKFEEIMTTVEINYTKTDDFYDETCGWVKVGGVTKEPDSKIKVGVHTTVTLRAEADSSSHYYGGWSYFVHEDYEKTDSVGADYHCDLTIRGKGAGDDEQSIYVSFPHLDKIYFKNWNEDTKTQLWDSVYVGFNPNHDGLGANVWGKSADDVRVMKREHEDTYNYVKGKYDYYCMWWSYVPRHITRTGNSNVVFFNKGVMRSYEHFAHGKAADRGDYNKKLNMFVPVSTKKETKNGDCDYYSNGYWRNFWATANSGQGYYLYEYKNSAWTQLGEFVASKGTTYENEFLTEMEYSVRLDNTSNRTYHIISAGGEQYVSNATITSAAPASYLKSNNTSGASFTMTPTAQGNYTFKVVQSSDTMDISVEYPVAIGDYILENTYNDGSAKTTRSDVIKAAKAADKTRYSMFLSNAGGAATLKLRKCTNISAGAPVWSAGDATNLGAVLTAVGSTPGVYQFDLIVDKTNNRVSTVDSLRLYTGNYYIKVDAAPGGWAAYTENVMDKNTVSFDRNKDYTYDNYWCKYYGKGTGHTANIKCVVANDYCNQLSDTLKQDASSLAWMSGGEPYLSKDSTSVRYSYNSATNTINRAYLGASLDNYYLDLKVYNSGKVFKESDASADLYTTSFNNTWAANCKFEDTENWVYEKLVKVIPGGRAGVVAKYQGTTQTFLPDTTKLLGGSGSSKYTIRLVYDFKTNFMMTAFVLSDGTTISENLADFDMLWVRHKDNSAAQLSLGSGTKLTHVRPIGAIEFRYDSVYYGASHTGNWVDLTSWNNPGARQYLKYFVSFPFDVELNSIFGLNQARYGRYDHYVIQKYDGAARAKEGLFYGDGDNYWVDLEPGDTLHANEGYCVIFDNDYVRGTVGQMWDKKKTGSKVYLYFPAINEIASITNNNTTTTVAPHTCTSDRSWTTDKGKTKYHSITDSHWSLIGNPLFHDAYIKDFTNGGDSTLKSYYYMDLTSTYALQDWQPADITKGTTQLKAMSSVLVQWYGTINWGTSAGALSAPKRNLNENKNYAAELQISYNGNKADQTFVHLEEGANEGFELREDMCKVLVKARPNIYTFTGDYDVAYNEMPIANCTIPVGVVARKNGTYTFSMPSNFSGTVTLIDTYTQTRTNLNIEDYEVDLNKGTIDDRFLLEININNAPTAIDGVTDGSGSLKDGKVHKFIMNDQMYIIKDGVIYDARGACVQ